MRTPGYISGDPWKICEVCGFQYRASQTFKRWDGLIVCEPDYETRHPQDFVRGRADRQIAPDSRPEQVATFIGPLLTTLTAAAVAGATSLTVDSSARFGASDIIGVFLGSGDVFRTVVQTVPTSTGLTILPKLPGAAASGATVINYSAVAGADIG